MATRHCNDRVGGVVQSSRQMLASSDESGRLWRAVILRALHDRTRAGNQPQKLMSRFPARRVSLRWMTGIRKLPLALTLWWALAILPGMLVVAFWWT